MNMIQKVSILFPQASIPKPSYFKTHLWNIDVIIGNGNALKINNKK